MFDIITFYKPITMLAEEGKGIGESIAALFGVFAVFLAVSAAAKFLVLSQGIGQIISGTLIPVVAAFIFLLVQVPLVSAAIFLVSRPFSKKSSLQNFISLNFFLLACTSLMMLVILVPFAEFAGLVMLPFGFIIYLYFLEGLMEKQFGVVSIQALSLLVFYLLITFILAQVMLVFSGVLQVPVQ